MASSILKTIAGLCIGLGAAGSLFALPTCPTTGTDVICTTVSGTLTLISGPDPLALNGSTFTAVSTLNAVGSPFVQNMETYNNVPLSLGVSSSALGLSCSATLVVSTSPSKDQFNVTNCIVFPGTINSTLTTNISFAGNTIPQPLPLAINAAVNAGSTATYVCGLGPPLCNSTAPTVLGISAGNIASTCIGCAAESTTPSSIPTFNGQVGGTPQTSAPLTVNVSGGSLPFALTTTTVSGGNWLTVSEPGGTTGGGSGSFTVTATPGSLAAGTYNGTVKVWTAATNSPLPLAVTFVVAPVSFNLLPNPTSFTFNSVTGVPVPTQQLSVTTSPPMSVNYTATASTTSGGSWLSVSPTSGTTGGASLTVTANPSGLAGGTYTGMITLAASGATMSVVVPVTLKVTTIATSPTSLSFSSPMGGPAPPAQNLSVTSTAGMPNVSYAASATTTTGGSWLMVTPSSGTTNVTTLSVSVIPGTLTAGTYHGNVVITPTGATTPTMVPVTYTVSSLPSLISSPTSLTFTSNAASPPGMQTLSITSSAAPITYTTTVGTTSGGNWLSASPSGGTTPGTVTVSVNVSTLATGTYSGSVTLTSSGAGNSPLVVPVTLNVTAALMPNPTSLTFTFTTGGSTPPAQSVMVTSNGASIMYTAAASTTSGGNWLSVSPSGTITTPAGVTVSVNPTGLAVGTYNGTITLTPTFTGNTGATVAVTLSVSTAPTVTVMPTLLSFAGETGGSNPASQTLTVSSTGGSVSFTDSASTSPPGGTWLSVAPTSGSTSSPATLTVSINTAGLASGTYNGTITVSAPSASNMTTPIPVTLTLGNNVLSATPATLAFTYTVGGTTPASQTVALASTGSGLSFTAAAGASWLGVTPTSGTTPATLTISATPTGLTPGVYNSMITVTAANASNSPLQIPVSLTVTAAQMLTASPTSLTFSYNTGGTVPPGQTVSVSLAALAVPFSAAATTTSGGSWLLVAPTSGTTPGTVTVTINPAGLAAGTYMGAVNLTSTFTANPTVVPVTLTVSGLIVSPQSLTFSFQTGGSNPPSQNVTLSTTSGSATFTATASTTSGGNWLSVIPTSGTASTTGTLLMVTANPAGLAAGTYSGSITIAAAGFGSQVVSVTFTITAPQATILITGTTTFSLPNTSPPVNSSLSLSVSDGSAKSFTVTAPAVKWLAITPLLGTTPATLTLTVTPAGLTPGTYDALVTVSVPGTATGTKTVSITLTVTGATLTSSPSTLSFAYQPGQPVPPAQTLMITSATPVTLGPTTASVTWLQVTQATTTPASVQVSISPGLLAPGNYQGEVFFTVAGSPSPALAVGVTLSVAGLTQLTVTPASLTFSIASGATGNPQTLNISTNGVPLNFGVTGPTWLTLSPAAGVTPGTVTVTPVAGLGPGTYNGAIVVAASGVTNSPVSIPVTLNVGVAITVSMVQNAASYATGAVSPGLIVSIFGSGLGPQTGVSAALPPPGGTVATTLGGTQVMFDGTAAPLLYVSDGQVNAVVPFAVSGQASTSMTVSFGGNTSVGATLDVAESAPGIFTVDLSGTGQGAIINEDGTVNSSANPAPAGTIVAFYGTGGGQTLTPMIDGEIPGVDPNFLVLTTTATIGGQPAEVQYDGWAPGLVAGVIQVNIMIPSGTPSGPASAVVLIGSAQSQTVTVAVQ